MKTPATFTLALAAAFAFIGNMAAAQDEPDVEASNRPLWEAGVAGFALDSPAYPGAADKVQRGLVLPYFVYRGPILRAGGGTFGARMAKTDDFEVDIGFAGSLSAMSDDITVRTGMPDLGFLLEFGPRVKYTLGRPSANSLVRLEVPLRGVFEFQDGVHLQGLAFEPRITMTIATSLSARASQAAWALFMATKNSTNTCMASQPSTRLPNAMRMTPRRA